MSRDSADAVVIGAGHNGLVAAAMLADAGWDMVVLYRNAAKAALAGDGPRG
jgi:phytoene dehydrogenase-like protein